MSQSSRQHVAILAFPFASHPSNLFSFSRTIAAAAPDTTFSFLVPAFAATTMSLSPPAPPNLRVQKVSDGRPEEGTGHLTNIQQLIRMFLRATPRNFMAGLRAAEREAGAKVGCIVSNALLWMAEDVAEEIGARWVPLWMASPAGLLVHVNTDQLRKRFGAYKQGMPGWTDEVIDFIPGLSSLRACDLPDSILFDQHADISFLFHEVGNRITRATTVVLNTFQGLDDTIDAAFASTFQTTLAIGPLNLLSPPPPLLQPRDERCLSWLDRQEDASVAYVGFGTMVRMPTQSVMDEIARGIESSRVRFLWALRDDKLLPPGFLERTAGRGLVVPWAPQVSVLGHRAVWTFVTHCGWNAVMESVSSGVPMVCLPSFADQKTNARMVSEVWGIGEALQWETVTGEEVARSLEMVMKGEEGKRMRERIGKLRDKAIEAIGQGGSSSENFKSLLEMVCGSANEQQY